MKLNHNDFLHYPNTYDQVMFGERAPGVRPRRRRRGRDHLLRLRGRRPPDRRGVPGLRRGPPARACSPCCGATCAIRAFKQGDTDYHLSADLTGQANHLGVTIEADIIKQKQPENNGGYNALQVREDRPARLQPADDRPPHRPHPLAGGQLLRRADRAHQLGRRVQGRPTTWPRPSAPPSSTSGPVGPGSSWVARRSSGPPTRGRPSSTPSRTSTWTTPSPSPDRRRPRRPRRPPATPAAPVGPTGSRR